jgi:predicted lipid-binding transport protein (Tim44 family)
MKKTIAFAALALSLISSTARADERRGGDAALGALSGAVVFGPIGAVAGAVVGYTAGPSIAHSWGFRRSSYARERRRSARQEAATAAPVETQPVPNRPATPAAPAAQAAPPPVPKTASTAPPVQGLE